jgi:hypothetical protein
MSTLSNASPTATHEEQVSGVDRFAGLCAIITGIAGLLYSLSFVVLKNDLLSALFLMLGGLFATAALSMLYSRIKEAEATLALWAWVLSIAGAFGATIHGGYDLANAINPPVVNFTLANLPSSIDPRGLLTFGVAGLGFFGFAWLMGRSNQFSRAMSYLTYLLAVLLVVLYLGRLIILDAKNPLIVVVALLSGFIVNPLWYIWLGARLWLGKR